MSSVSDFPVNEFCAAMKEQLSRNEHKGGLETPTLETEAFLLMQLKRNLKRLEEEIDERARLGNLWLITGNNETSRRCVNAANFLMMLDSLDSYRQMANRPLEDEKGDDA